MEIRIEDSCKPKEPQPEGLRSQPGQKAVTQAVASVAAWLLLIHRESYQVRSERPAMILSFGPTHPAFVSDESSGGPALGSGIADSRSCSTNAICRPLVFREPNSTHARGLFGR